MEITSIEAIYKYFNTIGCLTFSTITAEGEPISRIAHLRGFDAEGIYFMTMHTKSFYKELKSTKKVSICGMSANPNVEHDANGFPIFSAGYTIRLTGDAEEISMEKMKAKNNPIFDFCIKDQEKYPAMVVFCITAGSGDIFDYDFELTSRENKLERIYISYNGKEISYRGLNIDADRCISCGVCHKKCSFLAIKKEDEVYAIDRYRCDECGDCLVHCPVGAIFPR
ncbi:MAG: 4Fe-4S binding protein [Bacillota bacterium]